MKKAILIIGGIILLLVVVFSLRFIIGGSEDDWICVDGEWVKHGVPYAPMPTTGCGEEAEVDLAKDCEDNNGTWLEEYQECEMAGEEWCEKAGGEFFECESACRHDPEAEFCTMQCVQVCKFNQTETITGQDPSNCVYTIEDKQVTLRNGFSEEEILPDSASKIITSIFSVDQEADIDQDDDEDAVVVLSQTSGGSGIFYYVALAINDSNKYQGTNAILLGDRIAPQTTEVRQGIVIVNYAERKADEPITAIPSVGVSKYLTYEESTFKELNFKHDLIELYYPAPASYISSPLTVTGQARGNWYFEADFPVVLVNWDGLIIAQGIAQAKVDPSHEDGAGWMTEEFVPFTATLEFTADISVSNRGALILKKDNPSGLPEYDDALEIPVFFK